MKVLIQLLVLMGIVLLASAEVPLCYTIGGLSSNPNYIDNPQDAIGDGVGTEDFRDAILDPTNFGPDGTSQREFNFLVVENATFTELINVQLLILNRWSDCDGNGDPDGGDPDGYDGYGDEELGRNVVSRSVCNFNQMLSNIYDQVFSGMDLWIVPNSAYSDDVLEYFGIPNAVPTNDVIIYQTNTNVYQDGPFVNAGGIEVAYGYEWNIAMVLTAFPQAIFPFTNTGRGTAPQFLIPQYDSATGGTIFVDGDVGTIGSGIVPPAPTPAKRDLNSILFPPRSPNPTANAQLTLNVVNWFVSEFCTPPTSSATATSAFLGSCAPNTYTVTAISDCSGAWEVNPYVDFADASSLSTTATISVPGTYTVTWLDCIRQSTSVQISYQPSVTLANRALCYVANSVSGTRFNIAGVININCAAAVQTIIVSGLPTGTTGELQSVLRGTGVPTLTDNGDGSFTLTGDIIQAVIDNTYFTLPSTVTGFSLPPKKIFFDIQVIGTDASVLIDLPGLSLTLCAEGDETRTIAWACFCVHH